MTLDAALNSFRVSALRNKMITLGAAKTFAVQSDASVPLTPTTRNIGTVSRAITRLEGRQEKIDEPREAALPKSELEVVLRACS